LPPDAVTLPEYGTPAVAAVGALSVSVSLGPQATVNEVTFDDAPMPALVTTSCAEPLVLSLVGV
jgi:hypothetical protein